MSDDENVRVDSQQTLFELEVAINNHFRVLWAESEQTGGLDYISDWALVIAFQDLTEGNKQPTYSVETRTDMFAHQIKGLLNEGIDWVTDQQHSDEED